MLASCPPRAGTGAPGSTVHHHGEERLLTTNPTPVPAVEASGLCRRYGRRWALVDVTFAVPRGAVVMVAGRNGSGKSTLLRVLATAIRADRGSARVGGWDVRTHTDEVRRRTAILGHASHLYEALTAIENLRIAARFTARPSTTPDLLPLLDEVGLAERAQDPVSAFSAGMRKRLSLALTLLQEPSVVLLDEPYGQLDPPGFLLIDRLLRRFRERKATVLMATHLLERGASLCDRGLVLEAGRVSWWGSAADLPSQGGLDPAGIPEPEGGSLPEGGR